MLLLTMIINSNSYEWHSESLKITQFILNTYSDVKEHAIYDIKQIGSIDQYTIQSNVLPSKIVNHLNEKQDLNFLIEFAECWSDSLFNERVKRFFFRLYEDYLIEDILYISDVQECIKQIVTLYQANKNQWFVFIQDLIDDFSKTHDNETNKYLEDLLNKISIIYNLYIGERDLDFIMSMLNECYTWRNIYDYTENFYITYYKSAQEYVETIIDIDNIIPNNLSCYIYFDYENYLSDLVSSGDIYENIIDHNSDGFWLVEEK